LRQKKKRWLIWCEFFSEGEPLVDWLVYTP